MFLHTLMFGWEYPPKNTGGLGVATQGIVQGLIRNGIGLTLVLPNGEGIDEEGLDVRSPGKRRLRRTLGLLHAYDTVRTLEERLRQEGRTIDNLYAGDIGALVVQFEEFAVEMTKDVRPAVIHCHDWMTFGAGIRASSHHGVPLVIQIHATELDRTNFRPHRWIESQERRGLLAADRVIAVSNYSKDLLVRHYGVPEGKITVIHNAHALETAPLSLPITARYGSKRAPLVLFVGRLTIQKNPCQFLEVAHHIHNERPDVQFVMVGEGYMFGELIERSCVLGLQDCLTLAGRASRREVEELMRRADCLVMPSLSEPFGLVALEAIAHGTPVVLSKQCGAREVLKHCFTVDFWDTEKMADCVLTILREKPLALQLRSEAPRILQTLTWTTQARRIRAVYEDVLSPLPRH